MSTRIFLAQLRERSGGLLYEYQQAMVYRWFSAARLAHWGGVFAGCTPNIEIACGSSLIKKRLKLGLAGPLRTLIPKQAFYDAPTVNVHWLPAPNTNMFTHKNAIIACAVH